MSSQDCWSPALLWCPYGPLPAALLLPMPHLHAHAGQECPRTHAAYVVPHVCTTRNKQINKCMLNIYTGAFTSGSWRLLGILLLWLLIHRPCRWSGSHFAFRRVAIHPHPTALPKVWLPPAPLPLLLAAPSSRQDAAQSFSAPVPPRCGLLAIAVLPSRDPFAETPFEVQLARHSVVPWPVCQPRLCHEFCHGLDMVLCLPLCCLQVPRHSRDAVFVVACSVLCERPRCHS